MVKVYSGVGVGVGDADVGGTIKMLRYNLVLLFLSPMSVILRMTKVHPGVDDTNVSYGIHREVTP